MIVHVSYTPNGDAEKLETWELDYDSLTVEEATTIETMSNKTLDEFEKSLNKGFKSCVAILVYIARQRADAKITWADVTEMRIHDVTLWTPKPEAEGKAPARARARKTPAA